VDSYRRFMGVPRVAWNFSGKAYSRPNTCPNMDNRDDQIQQLRRDYQKSLDEVDVQDFKVSRNRCSIFAVP